MGGLPIFTKGTLNDLIMPYSSAPAGFAQLAAGLSRTLWKHRAKELKRAMAHVSWKSHQNGAKNPKAHLQEKPIELDTILKAPIIADPLGLFDLLRRERRCGPCAIVTTPDIARGLGKKHLVTIKALQLSFEPRDGSSVHSDWDGSYVRNTRTAAKKSVIRRAGIRNPRVGTEHDGST